MIATVLVAICAGSSIDVAVISTSDSAQAKLAAQVAVALEPRAALADVSRHLAAAGKACRFDAKCACSADSTVGAAWVLDLRYRALPSGRAAVDLRLLDRNSCGLLVGVEATVERGEAAKWAVAPARRLIANASPGAAAPAEWSTFGAPSRAPAKEP